MGIYHQLNSKLILLLKDSILVSTDISNKNEIIFDFISKESGEWARYYLYIRNFNNFYFQRYESSFQRSGIINLRRINIKDDKAEWINEISNWRNLFTKESGIEFKLYNGSIFRFVGSDLSLEQSFVEGPIDSISQYIDEKPDIIVQSKAKVIVNETFTKMVIDKKSKTTNSDLNGLPPEIRVVDINLDDEGEVKRLEQFDHAIETIDPELEKALNQIDNLTDKEKEDSVEINKEPTQVLDEVNYPENIDTKNTEVKLSEDNEIVNTHEGPSLINQISEYAFPRQTYNLQDDNNIEIHEDESITINSQKSIKLVNGVTESNLTSIEALGFNTILKLSVAKIAELTKINGIGKATARKIIQSAKNMIDEHQS